VSKHKQLNLYREDFNDLGWFYILQQLGLLPADKTMDELFATGVLPAEHRAIWEKRELVLQVLDERALVREQLSELFGLVDFLQSTNKEYELSAHTRTLLTGLLAKLHLVVNALKMDAAEPSAHYVEQ
jgi:hypothetical protein